MPLPPFHFGPGLAAKSLAGRHFSFFIFGLSQFLIDLEPFYYILRQEPPLHRFLHSYLGASVLLVVVLVLGKPFCEFYWRRWNTSTQWLRRERKPQTAKISWLAATTGAAFGVYSHVFLDSIMHDDVRPFAPFSDANPLLHRITLAELHIGCVIAGVFGLMTLVTVKK
jgi:hypothetical protein